MRHGGRYHGPTGVITAGGGMSEAVSLTFTGALTGRPILKNDGRKRRDKLLKNPGGSEAGDILLTGVIASVDRAYAPRTAALT